MKSIDWLIDKQLIVHKNVWMKVIDKKAHIMVMQIEG